MDTKKRNLTLGGLILGLGASVGYTIYSVLKKENEEDLIMDEDTFDEKQ